MANVLLVRYGEIHLKGQNRPFFEKTLVQNVLKAAQSVCKCGIVRDQGRFILVDYDVQNEEALLRAVNRVFGVHSVSPAVVCDAQIDTITATAIEMVGAQRQGRGTFKVEGKRANKQFPLESPELARRLGGSILAAYPALQVDVHEPQWRLYAEVRERAYVYTRYEQGPGGMPTGTGGSAMLLLSGGIDSPVAGYQIARRGVELQAVYFDSPPHTSNRAREKVETLAAHLADYCGAITLHTVRFTEVQEKIYTDCRPEYLTILMRRFMMRLAEAIAVREGCGALVTGENLGQVASQTLESMAVTNAVCRLPVLRPLISLDKVEIIEMARKIGTYDTSILPYEDCCTVFVPRHPVTRPTLHGTEAEEAKLDVDALCAQALENTVSKRMTVADRG